MGPGRHLVPPELEPGTLGAARDRSNPAAPTQAAVPASRLAVPVSPTVGV
jgi:hypothetical protein